MNEDERGITPADITAITIDRPGRDWRVIIEQGDGAVIKMSLSQEAGSMCAATVATSSRAVSHKKYNCPERGIR